MMKRKDSINLAGQAILAILVIALLASLFHWKPARPAAEGEVVAVLDGDTIEVMEQGRAVRVRLAEIDCPEKGQAYGNRAKQFTSENSFGKQVKLLVRDHDRYERTVAEVILPGGQSLNRMLVKAGLAWWYRQYSHDSTLGDLEREARAARRGLWADPKPMPPWEFRSEKRSMRR